VIIVLFVIVGLNYKAIYAPIKAFFDGIFLPAA